MVDMSILPPIWLVVRDLLSHPTTGFAKYTSINRASHSVPKSREDENIYVGH